jgi:polyribonucleotide nucleotidyltransferase
VEDELHIGDIVKVKVLEINGDGKVRLSRRALLDPPPPGERSEGDRDRGDRGGDRGERGGDRGDRGGQRRGGGGRRREKSRR